MARNQKASAPTGASPLVYFESEDQLEAAGLLAQSILGLSEWDVGYRFCDSPQDEKLGSVFIFQDIRGARVELVQAGWHAPGGFYQRSSWIVADHAYVLLHELVHILMHQISVFSEDGDTYPNEEYVVNRIAMAVRPEFVRRWNELKVMA